LSSAFEKAWLALRSTTSILIMLIIEGSVVKLGIFLFDYIHALLECVVGVSRNARHHLLKVSISIKALACLNS